MVYMFKAALGVFFDNKQWPVVSSFDRYMNDFQIVAGIGV